MGEVENKGAIEDGPGVGWNRGASSGKWKRMMEEGRERMGEPTGEQSGLWDRKQWLQSGLG